MKIDWTKPLQTRDGRKVRYLGTVNDSTTFPVIIAVAKGDDGAEIANWVTREGNNHADGSASNGDILNSPVVEERWMNVYGTGKATWVLPYHTAAAAGDSADGRAQGQVKITYHDGVAVGCEFVKAT